MALALLACLAAPPPTSPPDDSEVVAAARLGRHPGWWANVSVCKSELQVPGRRGLWACTMYYTPAVPTPVGVVPVGRRRVKTIDIWVWPPKDPKG
jgi:hypothetical protein